MNSMIRSVTLLVVLAWSVSLVGCGESGPPRVAVSGTVTLDGESVPKGHIVFIPTEGTVGPKAGGEIIDGRFEIEEEHGPMVGKLRIEIFDEVDLGVELDDPEAFNERVTSSRGRLPKNRIPPRYNTRSTLFETTTESGRNEFTFDLKTK